MLRIVGSSSVRATSMLSTSDLDRHGRAILSSNMAINTGQTFGDDAPKLNPWTEDQLDYAPFARRLAQAIIGLAAPNGYVIGLHGKWGSGKSTAINFALAYIKKHNDENEDNQIAHIDFKPWIISGHQDLIAAFFKLLSEELKSKQSKTVGIFRKLLGSIRGTTDNLVEAAGLLALTIDPSGGIASRYATVWAKKATPQMLGRFLDDPSIQVSYEKLKVLLSQSGKRFLVTIDDIDRLEKNDIRSILQMVKSIGQLPNVTYLLAYDRKIVAAALDKTADDPQFTEKIVQQELVLPSPSRNALLSMLDKEITFLTADAPTSLRWQYIVRDGVHRWIRSPRDVARLSNSIKFLWPGIAGEVDPQDVLCMEGLRLFDAAVFDWVCGNRDLLFHQGRFMLSSERELKDAVGRLKSEIIESKREPLLKLLSVLFPQRAELFTESEVGGQEGFADISKRRGVGSEAGFDTYFALQPSIDAVPKVIIDELVASSNSVRIESVINGFIGQKNRRGELLSNLLIGDLQHRFVGREAVRPTDALLNALFRVAENVLNVPYEAGIFQLSPRAQLSFLIRSILHCWGNEKAGQHLLTYFEQSNTCFMMAEVYVARGRELGVFPSNGSERAVIDRRYFDQLGPVLRTKIETAASEGTLEQAPFYFEIVRAWTYLGGLDGAKAWLAEGINADPMFMAKVAFGFISYSVGTQVRRYTMREQPDPALYDLNILISAGKRHLQSCKLDDDKTALLTEVVRGAEQLLQGKSPETAGDNSSELED